jgi:hypothetical protein
MQMTSAAATYDKILARLLFAGTEAIRFGTATLFATEVR